MATPDIIERVELIRNKINELILRFLEIDFDGELEWHREDTSQNNVAIGVDSSYTSRIFKFAYLYLVRGVAIPYSSSTDLRSYLVSDSDGDVHFLAVPGVDAEKGFRSPSPPIRELKKISSHKSKDIEIELGYKAYLCVNDFVDEEDIIILMDRSGRGFLPYRFKKEDDASRHQHDLLYVNLFLKSAQSLSISKAFLKHLLKSLFPSFSIFRSSIHSCALLRLNIASKNIFVSIKYIFQAALRSIYLLSYVEAPQTQI
jgi:hypothetical protein